MAEKNWAKLLHAIYAGDQTEDVEPARRLAAATGLSDDEIERSLAFLQRQGLIEDEERRFVLTEKGFQVARQREMERSQFEMNFFLAAFTFILSLAIVVQTGYQLAQIGDIGIVAGAGLVAATLVLLVLLERKTDFLKLLMQGR